ncbi:homocysteine S-methyltransferase YbgG [Halobacillus andaensis]|uniref:S-methylmethionine:homocysteine methyltransferase n=1 Tax=Halobacillus andaensis TaxID=1176239 RepID=A0A917EXI7_HALAA|nr:homocysteine S-methyltransferase [Halobacillus andaensis]MBP2005679.1 homocysteine S-methyltransferase [Halobacillus andaensis]GGF26837.1 homocysteine S-methyltransferase YbgG [Halobacillus andaensis]
MSISTLNPIKSILQQYPTLILDGALATEIESHGYDLDDPLWSARILLDDPEVIRQVHYDYFKAGADCAITSSYQATIDGFAKRGIEEKEAFELMKKTVELARQARDDFWKGGESTNRPKPLVAGSVGPYGAYLADGAEYIGNYGVSDDYLAEFHRPRMQALVEAGADVLALETIPSFQESKVLASLLKEFPDTYAWISFTLKNGETISDGTNLQDCAKVLSEYEQVAAIGVNCSPIPDATEAISEICKMTDKPIIIYPNSGETYDAETNTWHGEESCTPFDVQSDVWYEAGARIIGGCCRTSPQHIESIAKRWR